MKTLVIHPNDPTTTFLYDIYKHKDVTLISDPATPVGKIADEINKHDRIIMCGHGCPDGLFGMNPSGFMISSDLVENLRDKDLIGIWCNADKFFTKYNLTGFYTGMFISEVGEASVYSIKASQTDIELSNTAFASICGEMDSAEDMFWTVRNQYLFRCNNAVSRFNHERMHFAFVKNDLRVSYSPMIPIEDKEYESDILEYIFDGYDDPHPADDYQSFYDDEDIDGIPGDFDPTDNQFLWMNK
jgi:hypothetical protein